MGAIKLGQTRGHANTPFGTKVYYKPSLGKVVFRKPGVLRRSEAVLARNKKVRAAPPAPKCEGLPWDEFTVCLAENMPS